MTIGIDFDNTMANTSEVSKKFLDEYLPGNNLESYHLLPLEDEIAFFTKYAYQITDNLSLFDGVKEAFDFFKENNIKTVLITARDINNKPLVEGTKKILEKNGIKFDKMCFGKPQKENACIENNVDLMIDDFDTVLKRVSNVGIRVLSYGHEVEGFDSVNNWKEVVKYVEEMIHENSRCK